MLLHIANSIFLLSVLSVPAAHARTSESTEASPWTLAQASPPPAEWRRTSAPAGGWRATPPSGGWRGTPPTPPPPPAERVERRKGFVWVQGDYQLRGTAYFWQGGHLERERPEARWHPGRWEWQGNQYAWVLGQWINGGG